MEFIETTAFTRKINDLLDDDEYKEFQSHLIENPERGVIIPGTNGLRKIRWALNNIGKRGGLRVIYFYYIKTKFIFLLIAYPKNEQDDLTEEQKKILSLLVKKEFFNE